MTEETTTVAASRRLMTAKTGLLGLAAAAIVAAAILAAGAWASPGGTLAVGGTTNGPNDSIVLAHGGFGGDMGGRGMRGGFGGGITITAISGSNISLKTVDGWTRTIAIASDTVLQKAGATIKLSDLKVGDEVRFRQTVQTDGSYKIDELDVVLPEVGGTVKSVSGSTITLTLRDGTTTTVTVSSSTTYQVNGATSALSGIKAGMVLRAEGTKASDGSIAASRIEAFDTSTFPGRGGHRGMGPDWDNGANPNASAAPTTNGTSSNG
jgi:hypothetical protein